MCAIVFNTVATVVIGRCVDAVRGKMKLFLLVLMVVAAANWLWMSAICLGWITYSTREGICSLFPNFYFDIAIIQNPTWLARYAC